MCACVCACVCVYIYLFTFFVFFCSSVVRDYDGMIFLREWNGGIAAGGFEPKAKPIFQKGIPDKFEFQLLPEDWDHFRK